MEKDNKLKNKNVETYTKDMVKAIANDKSGLIKKIIHEEEEHEEIKKNLSPLSKKNRVFVLLGSVLLILAILLLLFLVILNNNNVINPVVPQFASMIFTDQTDFKAIDGLSKERIIETILIQVNNIKAKQGGVNGIYLTENNKVVGFKKFISLIKSNLILKETGIINDSFLMGVFHNGIQPVSPTSETASLEAKPTLTERDFFILLKVRSFSDIFPIMLSWENKMLFDLHGFFEVDITPNTSYLFTKNFEDGIVENKNARVIKDKDGKIVLMYVFIDDSSVIITNSEKATEEVIRRLNSSQIKK